MLIWGDGWLFRVERSGERSNDPMPFMQVTLDNTRILLKLMALVAYHVHVVLYTFPVFYQKSLNEDKCALAELQPVPSV